MRYCLLQQFSHMDKEKDQADYALTLRLVGSEEFTPQMAINYLYFWRKNAKLLPALLSRIETFFKEGCYNLLPTAIFIMSLQPNQLLQHFCEKLSRQSLSCYLLLRWSYSTYLQDRDSARNKLDNNIFSKNQPQDISLNIQQLSKQIQFKQMKLTYTIALNDYYDRLFLLPQKLKKYDKSDRDNKLRQRLQKIHHKFFCQDYYMKGILLPLQESSCIIVRVVYPCCFSFSTKERVPFKIVYETISEQDLHFKKENISKAEEKINPNAKESLILPQSYFGTEWKTQTQKISSESPYSHLPSYKIQSFIIKSGDDLRQQHMAMQLISMVQHICQRENIKIWLKTYAVIPFDRESGLIEFVNDTRTVSYLKQKSRAKGLRQVYKHLFGTNWEQSVTNFVESLAGYSIVQYLFQIKDRHNNNILIDNCGHLIHIDFSFILSSSPGNFGFEKAPFKLTSDYLQLMEGQKSDIFLHFKMLFFFALKFIRKYKREIMQRVQIMAECRDMKCFLKYDRQALQKRFHENTTDQQLMTRVEGIIKQAINSYTTGHYDVYQWFTNYIYA